MTIHKITICRFERKKIMEIENTIKEEIAKLLAKDEFLSYEEAKYYAIIEHQKNKSRFFALYFDQMVYVIDYNDKPIVYRNFGNRADEQMKGMYKDAYLLLTPLSQISDEDAIEVAKIVHQIYSDRWNVVRRTNGLIHIELKGNVNDIYHVSINTFCCSINANHHFLKTETDDRASFKVNIGSVNSSSKYPVGYYTVTDFLRRKGYYVGDGTEIEYGWCKLTKKRPNN